MQAARQLFVVALGLIFRFFESVVIFDICPTLVLLFCLNDKNDPDLLFSKEMPQILAASFTLLWICSYFQFSDLSPSFHKHL